MRGRSLALLTSSLGLMSVLVALSTNFWFEAQGPHFSSHSGLWPSGDEGSIEGKGWGPSLPGWETAGGDRHSEVPSPEQATSM